MEKNSGYILILIGLTVMAVTALSVFKVFTGQTPPMELINIAPMAIETQYGVIKMEDMAYMSKMINLILHLFMMFFILTAGSKVAIIGVGLVKKVK